MKKYRYVRVNSIRPVVTTTDPSILDWLYDEVKKLIPNCATKNELHDLMGERIGFSFHRLEDKDSKVARWILKLLCENGFEPFATSTGEVAQYHVDFHLRREIET